MSRNKGMASWYVRRRIIISVLLFDCAVIMLSLLKSDIPTEVATVAISSAFTCGMAVVGSYVFGAIWDDKNVDDS